MVDTVRHNKKYVLLSNFIKSYLICISEPKNRRNLFIDFHKIAIHHAQDTQGSHNNEVMLNLSVQFIGVGYDGMMMTTFMSRQSNGTFLL